MFTPAITSLMSKPYKTLVQHMNDAKLNRLIIKHKFCGNSFAVLENLYDAIVPIHYFDMETFAQI